MAAPRSFSACAAIVLHAASGSVRVLAGLAFLRLSHVSRRSVTMPEMLGRERGLRPIATTVGAVMLHFAEHARAKRQRSGPPRSVPVGGAWERSGPRSVELPHR